jgi:hypothetical protein
MLQAREDVKLRASQISFLLAFLTTAMVLQWLSLK